MGKKRQLEKEEAAKDAAKKAKVTPEEGIKEVNRLPAKDGRLIVILHDAHLEIIKSDKKSFDLLNSDQHTGFLRKTGRQLTDSRPDITHQCLLMLLDSPLNRAGLLQVYIQTAKNVLIEVHPQTRIPRTFKRFSGLMVQLLHKFSVRASDSGGIKLLKVIKNPVTDHLPPGIRKICMSFSSNEIIKPSDIIPSTPEPICVVIGAIAKGAINPEYTDAELRIGNYPLSAALTCTKITSAFEEAWGVF
uniref:18S rRNA (pseudouridine-N1)-methyltransferase n=1 Tax=Caligus rogercresseyi TaxID=217165 RepID=C1BN79_CALRO|nr:Probable ribosome biogenesis protein NEP1 [Caligus rogercresseyi]